MVLRDCAGRADRALWLHTLCSPSGTGKKDPEGNSEVPGAAAAPTAGGGTPPVAKGVGTATCGLGREGRSRGCRRRDLFLSPKI